MGLDAVGRVFPYVHGGPALCHTLVRGAVPLHHAHMGHAAPSTAAQPTPKPLYSARTSLQPPTFPWHCFGLQVAVHPTHKRHYQASRMSRRHCSPLPPPVAKGAPSSRHRWQHLSFPMSLYTPRNLIAPLVAMVVPTLLRNRRSSSRRAPAPLRSLVGAAPITSSATNRP
jgi:hypothetical protein